MKLYILFILLFSYNSYSRSPAGEYSALVENGLKREDFCNKDNMEKYIHFSDKYYNKYKRYFKVNPPENKNKCLTYIENYVIIEEERR